MSTKATKHKKPVQRHRVRPGDVILVPLADSQYGLCKIIYASKMFRNMILMGAYDVLIDDPRSPTIPEGELLKPLIYTGRQGIGPVNHWRPVGNVPLLPDEEHASRRTVAGDVFEGDENLGPASEVEWESLPEQRIEGELMARRSVARLLAHRGAILPTQ